MNYDTCTVSRKRDNGEEKENTYATVTRSLKVTRFVILNLYLSSRWCNSDLDKMYLQWKWSLKPISKQIYYHFQRAIKKGEEFAFRLAKKMHLFFFSKVLFCLLVTRWQLLAFTFLFLRTRTPISLIWWQVIWIQTGRLKTTGYWYSHVYLANTE